MRRALRELLLLAGAFYLATSPPAVVQASKVPPPLSTRRDTLEHHVEDLAKYLKSGDVYERQDAEWGLRELGPKARGALPALLEILKGKALDRKQLDRKHRACWVLASIGPDAKRALPGLVKILEGPQYPEQISRDESNLHGSAANALAEIGPSAKAALPALAKIMDDKGSHARASAAEAVYRITGDLDRVTPVLVDILLTPGGSGRSRAAYFFGQLKARARKAIPALREIVRDPREASYLVPAAAWSLWKIEQNKDAVLALLRVLRSEEGGAWDAAEHLAEIGAPARDAIPALIEKLRKSATELKRAPRGATPWRMYLSRTGLWVRCLGKFGPAAKGAADLLRPLLKEGNAFLEMDAARSLWQIEQSPDALKVLQQRLQQRWPAVRLEAARVLHDLGKVPKEASPLVAALLRNGDFAVRDEAAEVLRKIDPRTAQKLIGK
jgi:HEAT repeat protein